MKSNEEIGAEAAKLAHAKVLREAKSVKLTTKKVLRRIAQGLDAKENRVFYDKDRGKCVVGPDMISWTARAKSIDQAMVVLDMTPKENDFDDFGPATPVTVTIEVIDASKSAGEQTTRTVPVSSN